MSAGTHGVAYPITIDEWFNLIGRGDLQDFQDCFTAETGICLSLIGRAGDALLIPSKERWFCTFSKSHFSHACALEVSRILNDLIKRYEGRGDYNPTILSCDFGLMEFYMPVYCDNHLIAFWTGGGFVLDDMHRASMLRNKFDVAMLTKESLHRNMRRLMATTRLLNVNMGRDRQTGAGTRGEELFVGKLTRREREVAELVCRGMSNREVAQALFLSEKTVKSHMSSILSKLGVRDRAQLVFEFSRRRDHGDLELRESA